MDGLREALDAAPATEAVLQAFGSADDGDAAVADLVEMLEGKETPVSLSASTLETVAELTSRPTTMTGMPIDSRFAVMSLSARSQLATTMRPSTRLSSIRAR